MNYQNESSTVELINECCMKQIQLNLALQRIIAHAKEHKANAVVGIKTTILPY